MRIFNILSHAATAVTITSVGTPPSGGNGGNPSPPSSSQWNYNGMAVGQAGIGSYSTIMMVEPSDVVGPRMPYFTFQQMKDATCMFCDNIWSTSEETNLRNLDNGQFPKHSVSFNNKGDKPAYKDYSGHTDDYIVGAYATEWAIYRTHRKYGFDSVPFHSGLDYVFYGFIPVCGKGMDGLGQLALCTVQDCEDVNRDSNPYFALQQSCSGMADGSLVIHDPWGAFAANSSANAGPANSGSFHHLLNAKAEYKDNIHILPSVGGWSFSKPFFDMNDPTIRTNFVNSAVNLLTAWPFFDGIDIDWEFPGGLGADAGKIRYPLAADVDQNMPAVSSYAAPCSPSPDVRNGADLWASFQNAMPCGATHELVEIDIPPLGCSKNMSKRQEIADAYLSWGITSGNMTKESYLDCTCDATYGAQIFTELRHALDAIPMSERPSEFTSHPADQKYQLTTAISGDPGKINELDYGKLVHDGVIDHIAIMSYDFMGAWGGVGHQANLWATPSQEISTAGAVQALYDQGVPSRKIIVGVATYGRGWKGNFQDAFNSGSIQDALAVTPTGPCVGDLEDGVVDYDTIVVKVEANQMKNVWDSCAAAHLTIGANEVYTGDSIESVFAKGQFVIQNNLAGLFTWEVAQDHYETPLLNAMNEALGRKPNGSSITYPKSEVWTTSECSVDMRPVAFADRDFAINCD